MSINVMKQALEALEDSTRLNGTMIGNALMHEPSMFDRQAVCKYVRGWFRSNKVTQIEKAITALRQAIEQAGKVEPGAWTHPRAVYPLLQPHRPKQRSGGEWEPLYAAPTAPAQQPLTDEQIKSMCKEPWVFETVKQWVHIIEAAHGIKGANHD